MGLKSLFLLFIIMTGGGVPPIAYASEVSFFSTADGRSIYRGGHSNWTTTRDSLTGTVNVSQTKVEYKFDGAYGLERFFFGFDTSGLPEGATINSAKIRILKTGGGATYSDDTNTLLITKATKPDGSNPLVSGDYSDNKDVGSISIPIVSWWGLPNEYFDVHLVDLTTINVNGFSSFRVSTKYDVENIQPAFYSGAWISISRDAILIVDYSVGGTYLTVGSLESITASVGTLFSDFWEIIAIVAGIPLAFYIITRVQGLILAKEKIK